MNNFGRLFHWPICTPNTHHLNIEIWGWGRKAKKSSAPGGRLFHKHRYAVLFSAGGVHHLTGSRQTLWLLKPPLGSCKLNLDWRSSPQRASYHIGLASNPSILSTWFCPSAVWYSWSWLSVQTLVPPPMATQYHLPAFCWSWRVSMLTRHYERLGLLLDSVLLELESESAGAGG